MQVCVLRSDKGIPHSVDHLRPETTGWADIFKKKVFLSRSAEMRTGVRRMPRFADGVVKFQTDVYPQKKELFERLSEGQSPEALFITCSDARIETAMITQTDPGELFISRNVGNIVPPHTNHSGGMTTSIEFAVSVLKVPHIVICGHTGCAAMKCAMDPDSLAGLPHVKEWLGYARAAVQIVDELAGGKTEKERMDMLQEQNVILQLRHLVTHPSVAAALAKGAVRLHGWVYDIKTGGVKAYNERQNRFEPVDSFYAAELASHIVCDCGHSANGGDE